MDKPRIIIVGADKGGVGKTTNARALLDFLDASGVANRAFDTQHDVAGGGLKRFFPDRTEIVDFSDTDGHMAVFDTVNALTTTVIDIAAGLLSPTLDLLTNIGFLDVDRYAITVLHVLGNNQASLDEIRPVAERLAAGARHIAVGNRINATKFAFPPDALDIPMLLAPVAEAVDRANMPFSVFAKTDKSAVQRGTVNHWLQAVYAQFASAKFI